MFGIFKKNKKSTSNHLIIDVGSGSVGSAILVLEDNKNFALTKVLRKETQVPNDVSFDQFVKIMTDSLRDVLSLMSQTSGKIEDVHVFLSSPWYASQSRDVSFSKEVPFVVTKKMIVDLLEKESDVFKKNLIKKYEGMAENVVLLETKVLNIKLNGYDTEDPVNKKTKSLEMNLFFSMSPEDIVSSINSLVRSIFQHSKIFFHTSSFSSFMALRSLFPNTPSFILCDIGAELTEVSSISSGSINQSVSFPIGSESFIKEIIKNTSKNKLESLSLTRMFSEGSLSEEETLQFSKNIKSIEEEWMRYFTKSLNGLSVVGYIPRNVFIFVKNDMHKYFESLVKQEPMYSKSANAPFSVMTIDPKTVSGAVRVASSEPRDVSLMISSFYMVNYINHHKTNYAENY